MTRYYDGARAEAANAGLPEPENDWLRCADCGRPAYYDTAGDLYHHALDAGEGCFLIGAENALDDFDHPLLADDTLRDAEWAAWEELKRKAAR